MHTINVSFEDAEIEAIKKAKRKQTWREFIINRAAIDSTNELRTNGINADALRGLCLEYDLNKGRYPESEYEGFSILQFYLIAELSDTDAEVSLEEKDWGKLINELRKAERQVDKKNE